jgi:transcriptional regulator with XRE-family HTH domain
MSWTITHSIVKLQRTIEETSLMRQPDLGRKISELRKAKGLTQEELVEKCNISVRTLQRIETGEVTPRSYTIKTILAALDYDLSTIEVNGNTIIHSTIKLLKQFLLLDTDLTTSSDFLIKQLNVACVFGILYFLIGFFESAAEFYRFKYDELIFSTPVYMAIKMSALITYIFFQRGFILLGMYFKNYLLRITSFLLISGNMLIIGYDGASIFYDSIEREFILGSEAIVFGCIGILYGIALLRLRKSVGAVATYAGGFEILAGCFFLTVILSFMGFITQVPSELFEILVLYKSIDLIKSKQKETL